MTCDVGEAAEGLYISCDVSEVYDVGEATEGL